MLLASPDWLALRQGRIVELFAATPSRSVERPEDGSADRASTGSLYGGRRFDPPVGRMELERDDVDLAFTGSPAALVAVFRDPAHVVLFALPQLDVIARLELPAPMRLATSTGSRLALLSLDGKQLTIARATGKGLAAAPLDPGSPVDLAIGLEKNQLLLALYKKLQVWDAVSGRPQLNLTLQLPPPPRLVGAAQGHLWSVRTGSDEIVVYRLSDGRPFKHAVHSDIADVVAHPASPLVVVVTAGGLVRLHCFSHQVALVESPWTRGAPLALLAGGDGVALVGATDGVPWRIPLAGDGAVAAPERVTTSDERASAPPPAPVAAKGWREGLVAAVQLRVDATLGRDQPAELPAPPGDSEVAQLAHRHQLGVAARRALTALYALHLAGETPSIGRLAALTGDWTEALGRGDLTALGLVRRRRGTVALRSAVADALDGAPPRSIRITGGPRPPRPAERSDALRTMSPAASVGRPVLGSSPTAPAERSDALRTMSPATAFVARAGRTDAAITAELVERLGRIATVTAPSRGLARALLEAQVRGATLVVFGAPPERPQPWPRDAGLVIVADEPPAWLSLASEGPA